VLGLRTLAKKKDPIDLGSRLRRRCAISLNVHRVMAQSGPSANLTFLKAHGKRCLATEPGTLQFEILVPQEEADTVMLYEVYASPEAFQTHWNGTSIQQMKQEAAGLQVSLKGVRCNLVE
jgi:quinol monooxygenase YgiN